MRRSRELLAVLLMLGVFCGGPLWWMYQGLRSLDYRCDEHPPAETFARYLGAPPPGVSDLRATGYSSLGGAEVFLRFRATGGALASLTRGYTKLPSQDAKQLVANLIKMGSFSQTLKDQRNVSEEHRVHWEELGRVRDCAAYVQPKEVAEYFSAESYSVLMVDRKYQLVYFYHWNQ